MKGATQDCARGGASWAQQGLETPTTDEKEHFLVKDA